MVGWVGRRNSKKSFSVSLPQKTPPTGISESFRLSRTTFAYRFIHIYPQYASNLYPDTYKFRLKSWKSPAGIFIFRQLNLEFWGEGCIFPSPIIFACLFSTPSPPPQILFSWTNLFRIKFGGEFFRMLFFIWVIYIYIYIFSSMDVSSNDNKYNDGKSEGYGIETSEK